MTPRAVPTRCISLNTSSGQTLRRAPGRMGSRRFFCAPRGTSRRTGAAAGAPHLSMNGRELLVSAAHPWRFSNEQQTWRLSQDCAPGHATVHAGRHPLTGHNHGTCGEHSERITTKRNHGFGCQVVTAPTRFGYVGGNHEGRQVKLRTCHAEKIHGSPHVTGSAKSLRRARPSWSMRRGCGSIEVPVNGHGECRIVRRPTGPTKPQDCRRHGRTDSASRACPAPATL